MKFVTRKPQAIYSEYHETAMSPTITVIETEKDPPKPILPNGTELVGVRELGFRPK